MLCIHMHAYIYLVGPPETEVKLGNFAQEALIMDDPIASMFVRLDFSRATSNELIKEQTNAETNQHGRLYF